MHKRNINEKHSVLTQSAEYVHVLYQVTLQSKISICLYKKPVTSPLIGSDWSSARSQRSWRSFSCSFSASRLAYGTKVVFAKRRNEECALRRTSLRTRASAKRLQSNVYISETSSHRGLRWTTGVRLLRFCPSPGDSCSMDDGQSRAFTVRDISDLRTLHNDVSDGQTMELYRGFRADSCGPARAAAARTPGSDASSEGAAARSPGARFTITAGAAA